MEPSAPKPQRPADTSHTDEKLKIYFLPNLLTGGNLFCGFVALTKGMAWTAAIATILAAAMWRARTDSGGLFA